MRPDDQVSLEKHIAGTFRDACKIQCCISYTHCSVRSKPVCHLSALQTPGPHSCLLASRSGSCTGVICLLAGR